jgi:hypothetical protein
VDQALGRHASILPPKGGVRKVAALKLAQIRPQVCEVTLAAHELSALLAGARMSLSLMETDPRGSTADARAALGSVRSDFDRALEQARADAER